MNFHLKDGLGHEFTAYKGKMTNGVLTYYYSLAPHAQ